MNTLAACSGDLCGAYWNRATTGLCGDLLGKAAVMIANARGSGAVVSRVLGSGSATLKADPALDNDRSLSYQGFVGARFPVC